MLGHLTKKQVLQTSVCFLHNFSHSKHFMLFLRSNQKIMSRTTELFARLMKFVLYKSHAEPLFNNKLVNLKSGSTFMNIHVLIIMKTVIVFGN